MPFDLTDCQFTGPALPEPFVKFELENELTKLKLLAKTTGNEGKQLKEDWEAYRRHLAQLAVRGGPLRVRNQAIEPLCKRLGYTGEIESADDVETREGREDGGYLLTAPDSAKLRVWTTDLDEDLDAPAKRGQAYRFSHLRIAQRVLLASGERVGLLTNGVELRLLISDPARPDSQVIFSLDPGWKRSRDIPDSFQLLLALVTPDGVKAIPALVDKARLQQARVTKDLRDQARQAIARFVQEVLDHTDNQEWLSGQKDRAALARALWHEGLIVVYRLLFILKLESSDDPARSFTFASTSLWRNTFSPTMALARYAPQVLYDGAETGGMLEHGLRGLFRMFHEGVECTELNVKPLGGSLFGADATPVLSQLRWGERGVAHLLDQLLWTTPKKKSGARERVHYGPLDVEDLGRVYEALLELEPGVATEPMCRLRRQKLEVVVPLAQGAKYRPAKPVVSDNEDEQDVDEPEEEEDEDESPKKGKKTTVQWIEEIDPSRFYLRVGLGRKATGSYYTPHSFVRFLVQETLGPQVAERSPQDDPQPCEILKLKVFDPACGSGHFLVESCRFLGSRLYEAARLCDERATAAERKAETAKRKEEREAALAEAQKYRQRVTDLPDPDDELLRYLPSRATEGEQTGYSQRRAEALCRRLVAVHCLYGVDKNPLAVELAKLALWLESHAEGMPLTFLDHRIVVGDSLTGPFWNNLITRPSDPKEPIEGVFHQGLTAALTKTLHDAIRYVGDLEATVGISQAEIENKKATKVEMDRALRPFRVIAAAWSGGVMLGPKKCDDFGYAELLKSVATTGDLPPVLPSAVGKGAGGEGGNGEEGQEGGLLGMIARGLGVGSVPADRDGIYALLDSGRCVPALSFDLTFPEVFYPKGVPYQQQGFDAVLSNPPWDRMLPADKEFFASFEFAILDAPTKRERDVIQNRLTLIPAVKRTYLAYLEGFRGAERAVDTLYRHQVAVIDGERTIGKQDLFRLFMERNCTLLAANGISGVVVPSAFHANEGATAIRRLYLDGMSLRCCYCFENRRGLFEIHRSFKFALVVAATGNATDNFACAFYLHDDEWLFSDRSGHEPLRYTRDFVRRTGGEYMTLLEVQSEGDFALADICFASGECFGKVCERLGIDLGRELNMTDDAWRFTPTSQVLSEGQDSREPEVATEVRTAGFLVLYEGKTFHQYTDRWEARPRNLCNLSAVGDKANWLRNSTYFRLSYRAIARSTDERTAIFALIPPGNLFGNSAPVERSPDRAARINVLALLGIANSYVFDWTLRVRAAANVNQFILFSCPVPGLDSLRKRLISHLVLSLTCNHSGYAPLWREQVGEAWREPGKPPMTWPVLAGDDERWAVRGAIDAVVADAYGLSRDQYAHVLSTFSHTSYRKAPELCLARFDELKQIGLETFTRKHDPYWDIPLNENLPQPVIDLPIPGDTQETDDGGAFRLTGTAKPAKRGRKKT
jgi:hypothetical protein